MSTMVGVVEGARRKWVSVLLFLAPINALMVFDRIALIVVTPILQSQLHLTLVETTVLISAVMWSYALFQIPAGWAVTRFGTRTTMFGALLVWSIATLVTPLANSFLALVLIRVVLGIGQSPDWPASVATVRSWFEVGERSKGTSVLLAGQYIGAALAAPVTTMIVLRSNWHVPFYLYGVLGLGLAAAWFLFFRERQDIVDRELSTSQKPAVWPVFLSLLRSSQFWALGGTYGAIACAASFINYMLPHYLIEHRRIDYALMGWLVGLPSVFLWLSVVVAGAIGDRVVKRTGSVKLARVPAGCVGAIVAGCATGATDWVDGTIPLAACLCLSFFGVGFVQVSLWSMAQDLTRNYTGLLTGWASAWGNLSAALGPILIAAVVEATGSWKLGLAIPIAAGFVAALMIWASRPDCMIRLAGDDQ